MTMNAEERTASTVLASIDVRTLYLRNVPDEVAEVLEELARTEGVSLNALAVRELTLVARRTRNAQLFSQLPDTGISGEEIVQLIREGRGER
jgi:hypothetical protein